LTGAFVSNGMMKLMRRASHAIVGCGLMPDGADEPCRDGAWSDAPRLTPGSDTDQLLA
jgi:hypothetical protein